MLFKDIDKTRCMKKTANPESLVYNGTIALGLVVIVMDFSLLRISSQLFRSVSLGTSNNIPLQRPV